LLNQILLSILDSQLAFSSLQLRVSGAGSFLDVRFDGTSAGIDAQLAAVRTLANNATEAGDSHEVWHAAQSLWDANSNAVIAKLSVLPANLHTFAALAQSMCASSGLQSEIVAQGVGAGWLRLEGSDPDAIAHTIETIRERLAKTGGYLVVYGCPTALKSKVDVWGPAGDAFPVMRRIKSQFDQAGTLNPGRFVGGI